MKKIVYIFTLCFIFCAGYWADSSGASGENIPFGVLIIVSFQKGENQFLELRSDDCLVRAAAVSSLIKEYKDTEVPSLRKQIHNSDSQLFFYLQDVLDFMEDRDEAGRKALDIIKTIFDKLKTEYPTADKEQNLEATQAFVERLLQQIPNETSKIQVNLVAYLAQHLKYYDDPFWEKTREIFEKGLIELLHSQDQRLKYYSAAALAYAKPAASHKFFAVLLSGLDHKEFLVRYISHRGITFLMPPPQCYNPLDDIEKRRQAIDAWRAWEETSPLNN